MKSFNTFFNRRREDKDICFEDPVSHEFMILMFRYKDECTRYLLCSLTVMPQAINKEPGQGLVQFFKSLKDIKVEDSTMNISCLRIMDNRRKSVMAIYVN